MVVLYVAASIIFAIFTMLTWKHVRGETGSHGADIAFRIVMIALSALNTFICVVMAIIEWMKSYQ